MAHFFVPPKNIRGEHFFFDPSESRHLSKSLRKKPGDIIRVFDGQGLVQSARITNVSNPDRIEGTLVDLFETERTVAGSGRNIETHIYTAVLKGPRFDWMLEKLTELAVHSIHPIMTERTIVRIQPSEIEEKTERWRKIILSAAKQCGRKEFAQIFPAAPFTKALGNDLSNATNLLLWECEEKNLLSKVSCGNKVNVWVGPEGGWSAQEAETALARGFTPVHLGENILRAETAAIAAASFFLFS